ncbi:TPA: recombinase family protein [Streptococcus suis]
MVLSLMASIAQEESRSISANIRWAIRNRMKNGTQKIPTSGLLGYDTDDEGNMVIIEQEAEIVRTIYTSFVNGVHPSLIAIRLNALGLKTVYGNDWSSGAVRKILRNEKYCGDVLMQKTITIDYLSHQTKINEGEAEQYFIADHHDPIVDKEVWNKAQEILDKTSWRRWKRREQQRLMPVKSGRLKGFVSISTEWKDVSVTRLISASKKVMTDAEMTDQIANDQTESEETIMAVEILEGFEEVQLEESKGDSVLTLTSTNIKFNKATAQELGFPAYVRMLINATTRQAAIQPCKENAKNAVPFSKDEKSQNYAVVIKIPALMTAIRKLADTEEENVALSFKGTLFPNDKIIIYDISKGEPVRRRGRKKKEDQAQAAEEQ